MEDFKFEETKKPKDTEVCNGDLRIVNIPVRVIFEKSDRIITDWDDDSNPLEFTSGYLMNVIPNQVYVHKGEESKLLAHVNLENDQVFYNTRLLQEKILQWHADHKDEEFAKYFGITNQIKGTV